MNTRQTEIVDLLEKAERLEVRRLAERFEVSQMTIRRDLGLLEEQGFLVRTHGGGIPAAKLRFLQSAFPHYTVSPEKAAIGKLAASVPSGRVLPGCPPDTYCVCPPYCDGNRSRCERDGHHRGIHS